MREMVSKPFILYSQPAQLRCAVFRAIEAKLDRVHAAGTERERGAADDYSDHYAGDEAPLDDDRRDCDQRQVADELQLPHGMDEPAMEGAGVGKEQETAQRKL